MKQDLKIVFDSLERRFKGRQMLGVKDLSLVLGRKRGTIYNQISAGTLPIPVVKNGGHPRARLVDVARYLASK